MMIDDELEAMNNELKALEEELARVEAEDCEDDDDCENASVKSCKTDSGNSRSMDIQEDAADTIDAATDEICDMLRERNRVFVRNIVEVIGAAKSVAIAREADVMFNGNGILVDSGSRKKSKGGTFFHLARQSIDPKTFSKLQTANTKFRKKYSFRRAKNRPRKSKTL